MKKLETHPEPEALLWYKLLCPSPWREVLYPKLQPFLWPFVKHIVFEREIRFKWVLSECHQALLISFISVQKKQNSENWIDLEANSKSNKEWERGTSSDL